MDGLLILWHDTGLANFQWPQLLMIAVGCLLLYLAIVREFEPLLLLPIGFGAILANIPNGGFTEPGGILYYIYHVGIESGVFPLLIFLGVGALTDFSSLIANPKTLLLGAAAQFGIFGTLLGAIALNELPGVSDRLLFLRAQEMRRRGEIIAVAPPKDDHPYSGTFRKKAQEKSGAASHARL